MTRKAHKGHEERPNFALKAIAVFCADMWCTKGKRKKEFFKIYWIL